MILEEPTLTQAVKTYTEFTVGGKPVKIPYHLARGQRWQLWNFSSKGTPTQIKRELEKKAQDMGFDLHERSGEEISTFMKENKVGVDCSGFVFHVLDSLVKERTGKGLGAWVRRYSGVVGEMEKSLLSFGRVRRIGTKDLIRKLNAQPLTMLSEVKPGDLLWRTAKLLSAPKRRRRHIMVIIKVEKDDRTGRLTAVHYAHSSRDTAEEGPHVAVIEILQPEGWLEKQHWLEELKDGKNYGDDFCSGFFFFGISRLKCLNHD